MKEKFLGKAPLLRAIKIAGSQEKLADLIGTTQQAISWTLTEANGKVSAETAIKIDEALAGQVKRQELRPDIFHQ